MPDDPVPSGDQVPPRVPAEELRGYLISQLRAAGSAAVRAGADPKAVTADLNERLRRVRQMLSAVDDDAPTAAGDAPAPGVADGSRHSPDQDVV
jgi:hypothetical protein